MKGLKKESGKTTIIIIILAVIIIGLIAYIIINKTNGDKIAKNDNEVEKSVSEKSGEYTIKVDGKTEKVEKGYMADYYGRVVKNYTANGKTYRLFYIDFDGKYGEAGTTYIMADFVSRDEGINAYAKYNSKDLSVMKALNTQWAQKDGVADTKHECKVAWLCDTANWKDYVDENANYAVGAPSLEMYVDSFNDAMGTSYNTRVNDIGYEIAFNENGGFYQSGYGKFTTDNNNIYVSNLGSFWIASPVGVNEDCIYASSNEKNGLVALGGSEKNGLCPIVSLKNTFKIELE